jgi:hypothetical protein
VKSRAWALPALLFVVSACGSSNAASPPTAAVVNGHEISMEAYTAAFRQERQASIDQVGYDACVIKSLKGACDIIKQRALNDVIDAELVSEYAKNHGITVSPSEDNTRWKAAFLSRFDNRTDVEHAWLRRIGISEADLRRSLHQDWLEQKVIYSVTAGLSQYQPSIRLAQITTVSKRDLTQVQTDLSRHIPFLTVAAAAKRGDISGCSTSANACGDLGWTPDSFVPPYRRQLLSAPVGSIVGPITEQNDSIFFQVEARSPHVKLTPQQLYLLRQQKFAAWVQQQQKRAKVTKYVAV